MGPSSPGSKASLISQPQAVHNGLTPHTKAGLKASEVLELATSVANGDIRALFERDASYEGAGPHVSTIKDMRDLGVEEQRLVDG